MPPPRKGRGLGCNFTLEQKMAIRARVRNWKGLKTEIYFAIATELNCTPRLVRFIVTGG